ncbi:MAG: hypothetical protein C5B52_19545 [Bacteroidetes bacterium]|nr:MAG: hypothetical protein C5B52_19545 [Bacteroidota bacterium]
MKKLPLVLMAGMIATSAWAAGPKTARTAKSAKAAKVETVTYFAERGFAETFGNVPNVVWEINAQFDKANFEKNGKQICAYFSKDGEFIGTTFQVKFEELPKKAQDHILKKYGTNIVDVFQFDDNEASDATLNIDGITFPDNDNYFVAVKDSDQSNIILQVSMDGEVSFFERFNGAIIR